YLASLAAVATPEEFTTVAVPLIERDRDQSGATRAYASALRVANKAQEAALKTAIKRRQIRTRRRSSGHAAPEDRTDPRGRRHVWPGCLPTTAAVTDGV
ncbi:MAG TPA: hypothetical protein VGC99_16850, partial [Candidatus Tectomicrobia bacterium]